MSVVGVWILTGGTVLGIKEPGFGIGILAAGAIWLPLLGSQFVRTTHYMFTAKLGKARVLHHAFLGENGGIHIVRFDLEVHGPDGDQFTVERHFKVSESGRKRVESGEMLAMKYLHGRPDSVLYGRGLQSGIIK